VCDLRAYVAAVTIADDDDGTAGDNAAVDDDASCASGLLTLFIYSLGIRL
jgi:hypothetical protein